ncbi:MAG: PAS domain-containing protein, partial [Anaerolineae bacterium]|nr:PAS domain-containing protein [Anaerolineae bacterium]
MTQQIVSMLAAAVVRVVCIAGHLSVSWLIQRINKITHVADQLAAGEEARTHMTARDELGAMGVALDRYAAAARLQVQQIQSDLRQERRQVAHLQAVLEGLPHGVLIQDVEGRVMTMNGAAREMLGVYGDSREAQQLKLWAAQVSDRLGREVAPGIFSINETTQIPMNHKLLHVQAVSLVTIADKPVGTVLMLQDITDKAVSANRREAVVNELAQDAHVSPSLRVQTADTNLHTTGIDKLAQDIAQDSRAMQRMITEYRDLTLLRQNELREQAVHVADLLLALAEEWRSLAAAAGIDLEVSLPEDDVYVLGDEKRLRMALGNLLDNSIKYATSGAQVYLQAYPI